MSAATADDSPLVRHLEATFAGDFTAVPGREFDVADHGAMGDGETRCTDAIQATIDAAAAAGGGVVTFPEGTYLAGAIFLQSNVELHLHEDVVLKAVQDDDAYPTIPTRVAGIEVEWPAALVNIHDEENVRLTGEGVIDGNGKYWWQKFADLRAEYEQRGLRWAADYDCERVRPVVAYNAEDVFLEGFTIRRQGFWAVTMTYCDRVHVDGVTVRGNIGGRGPSTDGINTDSSRNVLVEGCNVDGNDDCLCIKAGRDADGLRVNRPTENVVYRNCVTHKGGGLVTIGSETAGGVRNVEAYDLRAEDTNTGIRFKSAKVRGGTVENVRVHDIELNRVGTPFDWELDWNPEYSYPTIPDEVPESEYEPHWETLTTPVEPPERGIPEFRDITIAGIEATDTERRAWYVNGYPEQPIHDVCVRNVTIDAPRAGKIHHATDWNVEGVTIQTPDGTGVELKDCANVERPETEMG